MPAASVVATKSVRKFLFGVALVLAVMTATALLVLGDSRSVAKINGRQYEVTIADTTTERQRGLSGRTSLARDHGMVFVFDQSDRHCMWMKDMRFAIDMLWVNDQGVVVHQARDVSAETYPQAFCNDSAPARYVIELPAGSTRSLVGAHVSLPNL